MKSRVRHAVSVAISDLGNRFSQYSQSGSLSATAVTHSHRVLTNRSRDATSLLVRDFVHQEEGVASEQEGDVDHRLLLSQEHVRRVTSTHAVALREADCKDCKGVESTDDSSWLEDAGVHLISLITSDWQSALDCRSQVAIARIANLMETQSPSCCRSRIGLGGARLST